MKLRVLAPLFTFTITIGSRAVAQVYDTNDVVVQTFAGSGFYGYLDGEGTQTMFNNPSGIVCDSLSNFFVLDVNNSRIRKITPEGTVSTFVGGGSQWPTGTGISASIIVNSSSSIAIDRSNVLWVATSGGYLIRVGTDAYVSSTLLNGTTWPWGVCVDSGENVYISDSYGNKIWRYRRTGVLEVFAGSGNLGSADGNGLFTSFNTPTALAADSADNLYVWDSGNRKVRRINQNRDVQTLTGGSPANADGQSPSFNSVFGMCVDSAGELILACGSSVRKMSVTTNAVTMAGSFTQTGYANGAGNVARFNGASGVCISQGAIFVAESANQRIRSITLNAPTQPVLPANLRLNTYPGLQITGAVGRSYQIQSSPDMTTWSTVATLLLTSSPYLWIDQNPVAGNEFCRALLLP